MELKSLITQNNCTNTISGWIWYCDNCVTHGNANSSDEAEYMAEQHSRYFSWLDSDTEKAEEEESIDYMDYDPLTRDDPELDWQYECLPAIYLINVDSGITYGYGDNYTDETPNKITDIALAIELQKKLGLQ